MLEAPPTLTARISPKSFGKSGPLRGPVAPWSASVPLPAPVFWGFHTRWLLRRRGHCTCLWDPRLMTMSLAHPGATHLLGRQWMEGTRDHPGAVCGLGKPAVHPAPQVGACGVRDKAPFSAGVFLLQKWNPRGWLCPGHLRGHPPCDHPRTCLPQCMVSPQGEHINSEQKSYEGSAVLAVTSQNAHASK